MVIVDTVMGVPGGPYEGRIWDGHRWSGPPAEPTHHRPPPPRWSIGAMSALTALGLGTVIATLALSPPCVQYGPAFDCDTAYLSSAAMWLAWLGLLALAVAGTAVVLRATPAQRRRPSLWLTAPIVLAYAAVLMLFPPVIAALNALNAGL